MKQYQDLLDLAIETARRAAAHIRGHEHPSDSDNWDRKGRSDYVTEVDRSTELLIKQLLLDHDPSSTVLGEELSPEATSRGLLWIVDPIDGTTNYLHGYPAVGVSIAAAFDGHLVVGVVADVTTGDLYHAVANQGAWHGRRRLKVSAVSNPAEALIGTGFPFKALDRLPRYLRDFDRILRHTSGIRRAGAASLDFVNIAYGRFDGFWEPYLAPWDVAAGTLIVREAGGRVTDEEGSPDVLRHGAFVAGNTAIHDWLLEVLRGSDEEAD